jgi:hypothetical protein
VNSPKVLRFSIDINSSVPGSLGAGVVGIEVGWRARKVVAVSDDCVFGGGVELFVEERLCSGNQRWLWRMLVVIPTPAAGVTTLILVR